MEATKWKLPSGNYQVETTGDGKVQRFGRGRYVHRPAMKENSMGMPKRINPGKAIRMRMEELRSEYGISYRRIAEKSQVPYSTVKSIACGYDRDITLGTLVSLANFFGMTMREFLDSEVFDLIDADARKQCKGTFGVEAPGDFMDSGHLIDDRYPWELDACGGPKALRGLEDIDGLEDFRELRKKSEEWILWNNSQYQHRQD